MLPPFQRRWLLGRSMRYALTALTVVAASFALTYRAVTHHLAHAKVVQTPPYLAEMWIYAYGPKEGPNGKLFAKMVKAKRTDGAALQMTTVGSHLDIYSRRIEYPDGRFVTLLDLVSLRSSGHWSDAEFAVRSHRLGHFSDPCLFKPNEQLVSREIINGIATVRVTYSDASLWTSWRAPELRCEEIQYQIEKPDGGSYTLKTKAVNVRMAVNTEPDPHLFDSSGNYREVPPSAAERSTRLALGGPADCPTCGKDFALLDQYYLRHK
jgi:hypothetical protein